MPFTKYRTEVREDSTLSQNVVCAQSAIQGPSCPASHKRFSSLHSLPGVWSRLTVPFLYRTTPQSRRASFVLLPTLLVGHTWSAVISASLPVLWQVALVLAS